jgi:hypothetical protein
MRQPSGPTTKRWRTSCGEGVVAGARLDRPFADVESHPSLEDPEPFVVPMVDVERSLVPRTAGDFDQREPATGVCGRRLDLDKSAEPPARLTLASSPASRILF